MPDAAVDSVLGAVPKPSTAVDIGAGSTIAVRRHVGRQEDLGIPGSTATSGIKVTSSTEKLIADSKTLVMRFRGSGRKQSMTLYFWMICLFLVVFIILVDPDLDPIEGKYVSRALARVLFLRRAGDECQGRRVFMYDLPPEFNIRVQDPSQCKYSLIRWMDLCPRFHNAGYGEKLMNGTVQFEDGFDRSDWFETDFFMLEMIFHNRLQTYRCLTDDPKQADAFFIPYYTGLIALERLYEFPDLRSTFEERRLVGIDLIAWLEENGGEAWRRYDGRDHFIVWGRTTWDFKLKESWGTGFAGLPFVVDMTNLMLERDPIFPNELAIPYPTSFHPGSPKRLRKWIEGVENAERTYLFSYVGAPRVDDWSVRGLVSSACINAGVGGCNLVNCSVVKCSHDPTTVYESFLQSNFCLQPRGDSATRRSTFDCLISGGIPVFFHEDSAYTQYKWHLPTDPESYSVYIPEDDIRNGVSIQEILLSYSAERVQEMRKTIVGLIPNLLYNNYENDLSTPTNQMDAFELTIRRVLERIAVEKDHPRSVTLP